MAQKQQYTIRTDVKFQPLELVDVQRLVDECQTDWFNQTLSQVNDCVVRLGIVKGEFHWHNHDDEDEFFYVVSGKLTIDLADRSVELAPQQGFMVPKGVSHRTRAPERTVILMFEGSAVIPTGD
ncbi:MAG: cupin domain-containing protein [Negativicutes bacterium]|nr:cupin domain-containing protein [Negativicutes bacterium]